MDAIVAAAFVCFGLFSVMSVFFGIVYLARAEFMPYHQEAVGKRWEELDSRMRFLLQGMFRMVGAGTLATGIAGALLLAFPLAAGEAWTPYAFLAIGLTEWLVGLYVTVQLRRHTGASTPVVTSAAMVVLVVVGFLLSLL